jgi:hypothetical protein
MNQSGQVLLMTLHDAFERIAELDKRIADFEKLVKKK